MAHYQGDPYTEGPCIPVRLDQQVLPRAFGYSSNLLSDRDLYPFARAAAIRTIGQATRPAPEPGPGC